MTRRLNRILPSSFDKLDLHQVGNGFFRDPDKGPIHTFFHSLGSSGIDEDTVIPRDGSYDNKDPLAGYRDLGQETIRLQGVVSATSRTLSARARGIYDNPGYMPEPLTGHTGLACELIMPVGHFDRVRGDLGRSVVRVLCKVVYSGAMALGYNESCDCPDSRTCFTQENESTEYRTSLGSLVVGVEASSHYNSVATMSQVLPGLFTDGLQTELSNALGGRV